MKKFILILIAISMGFTMNSQNDYLAKGVLSTKHSNLYNYKIGDTVKIIGLTKSWKDIGYVLDFRGNFKYVSSKEVDIATNKNKIDSVRHIMTTDSLSELTIYRSIKQKTKKEQLLEESSFPDYKKDAMLSCYYEENGKDDFSNEKKFITQWYGLHTRQLSMDYISVKLLKINENKYIRFSISEDLGCASSYNSNKSFVKVKLMNNDILTFNHFGDTDCSDFNIIGKLSNSELNRLKRSPIKTIRFSGTKFYHDTKEDDIEWKTFFIDKLDCIK